MSNYKKIKKDTIEFYDKNSENYFENTKNLEMNEIYKEFLNDIPRKGKILDCGCGSGRDTLYFKKRKYQVSGFDASKKLVDLAKKHTGVMIKHNTFENFNTVEKFDGLFFMASLLHLKPNEFEKTLKKFKKFLNKNGKIYLSLKEGENQEKIDNNGRYFHYWSSEKVNEVLNKIGLEGKIFITGDKKKHEVQKENWLNFVVKEKSPKLEQKINQDTNLGM